MISVDFLIDSDGIYHGFSIDGHAEYAEPGEDIICAAVSALSQNTVNAIEVFTEDSMEYEVEDGRLSCRFTGTISAESKLLMNTLALGLENIENSYGNEYINIQTKEV